MNPHPAELRRHYFLPEYVVIAPSRHKRPVDTAETPEKASDPSHCPFCPGHEDAEEIYRVIEGNHWDLRVIPNKFPVFTPDNPRAYGYQELVIETPEHGPDLGSFELSRIHRIIDLYAERIVTLSGRPHIRYVLVFKNEGGSSGASLSHAHSQIFAISFVPPHLQEESRALTRYQKERGGCLYCEILSKERGGPRLVWEDEHATVFAPYAARSPHEVWVLPRHHHRSLANLSGPERASLAAALKLILGRLDTEGVAYNYYIHNSLPEDDHHLHIKIIPRLTTWGGFELGSGVVVNPTAPEESPQFYRPDAS